MGSTVAKRGCWGLVALAVLALVGGRLAMGAPEWIYQAECEPDGYRVVGYEEVFENEGIEQGPNADCFWPCSDSRSTEWYIEEETVDVKYHPDSGDYVDIGGEGGRGNVNPSGTKRIYVKYYPGILPTAVAPSTGDYQTYPSIVVYCKRPYDFCVPLARRKRLWIMDCNLETAKGGGPGNLDSGSCHNGDGSLQDREDYDHASMNPSQPANKMLPVALNDDDDDGNGVPDKDQPGMVSGENDLVPLTFQFSEALVLGGPGTVSICVHDSLVLWKDSQRQAKLTKFVYNLPGDGVAFQNDIFKKTLYVEGCTQSYEPNQEYVTLIYSLEGKWTDDTVNYTVIAVQSVEWAPLEGETNLTNDNPSSHGGGYRIFPDSASAGAPRHDKVKAKATLNLPIPEGVTWAVRFQVFDMDDPTQNANVVDPDDDNGVFNGDDNKGSSPGISPETETTVDVPSGSNTAELTYTVTHLNPGNNFKVAAHHGDNLVNRLEIDTTPVGLGLDFRLGTNGVSAAYKTSLLSVWRKLHVEIDTMDAPDASEPFKKVEGTATRTEAGRIIVSGNPTWPEGSLRGGVLNPNGSDAGTAVDFVGGESWMVEWNGLDEGEYVIVVKTSYTADGFDNDEDGQVDEQDEVYEMTPDEEEKPFAVNTDDPRWRSADLTPPTNADTISVLNTYYRVAYIECVEATGNETPGFGWQRNYGVDIWADITLDCARSGDFWAVCLAWGYDWVVHDPTKCSKPHKRGIVDGDNDPDGEDTPGVKGDYSSSLGITGPSLDKGLVFMETIRDRGADKLRVAAHEIGHELMLDEAQYEGTFEPDDAGMMGWDQPADLCWHEWAALDPWSHEMGCLSKNNINSLRDKENPWE